MTTDKEAFFLKMKAMAVANNKAGMYQLQKEHPDWFKEEVDRITLCLSESKKRKPLRTVTKPLSKSEQRRHEYQNRVDEKRKLGSVR